MTFKGGSSRHQGQENGEKLGDKKREIEKEPRRTRKGEIRQRSELGGANRWKSCLRKKRELDKGRPLKRAGIDRA